MPKLLPCILLLFFSCFSISAQTAYPTGDTSCIARWNFTNTGSTITSLSDVSGNGNNGSTNNIVTATAFRQIANKAMHFNGYSSVATVPTSSLLSPSAITIIALVQFKDWYTGTCQGNNIIYKSYSYYTTGCWAMQVNDNNSCSSFNPATETLDFAGPTTPTYSPTSNSIDTGAWYFLAVSFNGSTIKRYVYPMDTNTYYSSLPYTSSSSYSGSLTSNSYDVKIGATQNPSFYYWLNGDMDEIALFNRVLSDSEVHNVYHYLWGGISLSTNDTDLCGTNSFTVNYSILNPEHFYGSNVFTAQLSDATGSFSSPVNIGSVTSTTSGSITCTIPTTATYSTNYKIRIEASNTHFISQPANYTITYGPLASAVSAGNDTSICSGDTITLSANTISGASYLWNTSIAASSIKVSIPGTYIIKATVLGCSALDTVIVSKRPSPSLFIGNDTGICQTDAITIQNRNHSIGYTYVWSNGSTSNSISTSTAGTYSVTAQYNSCITKDTINISTSPVPNIYLGNDTSICSGTPLILYNRLSTGSGITRLWNTGSTSPTISATSTNKYWLKLTSGYCSNTDTLNLIVTQTPNINLGIDTTICQNTSLLLQNHGSTGSYTYAWNNGATTPTINIGTTGSYWLRASINNCADTDTVVVTVQPLPLVDIGNDTGFCNNYVLQLHNKLTNSALATYQWSNSATAASINTSTTGKYWLKITDNKCSNTDTINLTVTPMPNIVLNNDTAICQGNSVLLYNHGSTGNYSYQWNTGASTLAINATATGSYWLRASINNCADTDTVAITVLPLPLVDIGNDTTVCGNYIIPLHNKPSNSATAKYLWSTSDTTISISARGTGKYWLKVIDRICSVTDTLIFHALPFPVVSLGVDTFICAGATLQLQNSNNTPDYINLWSTGSTDSSISVNSTGTYWVTVNYNGCINSDTITATFTPLPVVNLGNDQSICSGQVTTLKNLASGVVNASYQWNTGSTNPTINVSDAGMYLLKVSVNNCSNSDTINVITKPVPLVNIGNDTTICDNDTIILRCNPQLAGSIYYWNTGNRNDHITSTDKGIYALSVTTNGCTGYDTALVYTMPLPDIELGDDSNICKGHTMLLPKDVVIGNNSSFTWSDGSTGNSFEISKAGVYKVKLSNDCGVVYDSIAIEYHNCAIWFPSVFSPNGDGLNDIAKLLGDITGVSQYHLSVYNRWGQTIFTTSDVNQGWNGDFNNKYVEMGTYYYLIKATYLNTEEIIKGDIALIR